MGEGRAVGVRKANPLVCLATPLLTASPTALFCTSQALSSISTRAVNPGGIHPETHCRRAFLPGSAQNVECDVTYSKQTTATSLPGSRFARSHARTSLANALSNRELHLLEPTLTHRKQTIAPRPNRELSTNPCFRNSLLRSACISHSLALFTLTQEEPQDWSLLTETGSHSETTVNHSKQTTASFLTGARIDTLPFHFSLTETHSAAPTSPQFATPQSLRIIPSLGKGDFDGVPVLMDRSCWIGRRGREARGCGRWKGIGS
jgi:hypothetical protein